MEEIEDFYNEFYCVGAGKIRISKSASWSTGGSVGFSFGVEWGRNEYAGGVLSKEEAVKLAKFILRTVNLENLLDD